MTCYTSVKQLRKCAQDTSIQVLQRGAKAEDYGGSVCLRKAPEGPAPLQSLLKLLGYLRERRRTMQLLIKFHNINSFLQIFYKCLLQRLTEPCFKS